MFAISQQCSPSALTAGAWRRAAAGQDNARGAVQDHGLAMPQVLGRPAHADHGRDAEAARQDGGVRHRAAELGDEAGDAALAHQDGVGGGQVGSEYDPSAQVGRGLLVLLEQDLLHPVDDVIEVVLAGPQVGVVHRLEDADQGIPALLQGPLGAAALLDDQVLGRVEECPVLEHQQVGVDELGDVLRGVGGNALAGLQQLPSGLGDGRVQPVDLLVDLGGLDEALRDPDRPALQQ
jgi:hypothetical protein